MLSKKTSAYKDRFNDPMWPKQWYFQDYRTEDSPVYDHNVVPVYNMHINGSGVTVAVLDEGIKSENPDLVGNYVARLSHNYVIKRKGCKPGWNIKDGGKDVKYRSHGTQVAGVIAMTADNGVCGVGVAFGAKFAGVVIMGPFHIYSSWDSTDSVFARGLVHELKEVDIYSNSWSFKRYGEFLQDRHKLTHKAISKGVTYGRGGKGAIYMFSAGNAASQVQGQRVLPLDNCASDGLKNNPHVILIAGASQWGGVTHYSEACPNVFATAYSSAGYSGSEEVVTTDANKGCTDDFGGTSAATAIASGIIALVLSANKELTYRDVMHLIAAGSEVAPLAENGPTWYSNAAGFIVSNDFGFGLLNAENMVLLARNDWERVPGKKICVVNIKIDRKVYFGLDRSQIFQVDTDGCQKTSEDGVFFLEQVELATTIQSLNQIGRGDFSIYLTSPRGTASVLMKPRASDRSSAGFQGWGITSVHYWGENPSGSWKIHVNLHKNLDPSRIASKISDASMTGFVKAFTLTLHGTTEKPAHYAHEIPYREYSPHNAYDQAKVLKETMNSA